MVDQTVVMMVVLKAWKTVASTVASTVAPLVEL